MENNSQEMCSKTIFKILGQIKIISDTKLTENFTLKLILVKNFQKYIWRNTNSHRRFWNEKRSEKENNMYMGK